MRIQINIARLTRKILCHALPHWLNTGPVNIFHLCKSTEEKYRRNSYFSHLHILRLFPLISYMYILQLLCQLLVITITFQNSQGSPFNTYSSSTDTKPHSHTLRIILLITASPPFSCFQQLTLCLPPPTCLVYFL